MKQKRIQKLVTYISILGFAFCLSGVPSMAITAQAESEAVVAEAESETIARRKDDIYWVYAEMNDKLYKRLYNATTTEWIGDWIYVKDL